MQSMPRRRFVLGGAALAAAGLGALSVFAATSTAEAQTTTTTTSTATTSTATTGRRERRGPGFGRGFPGADLQTIATALHLTTTQLQEQLRAGKSVAQIAQAQNVPLQSVKDAIVAAAKTRLDQAVAAGRLTSTQETQRLSQLQADLDQRLNAAPGSFRPGGPRPAGRRAPRRARPGA